jgi:hypothetical protein
LGDSTSRKNWKVIDKEDHFNIEVPEAFRDSCWTGLDTYMGIISSKVDSLALEYEWVGFEGFPNPETNKNEFSTCDINEQLITAREMVGKDYYKEHYGDTGLYKIYFDTVDSKIAIIILSKEINAGITEFYVSDCESFGNGFISIIGNNLSYIKQKLFLEICKTIKFHKTWYSRLVSKYIEQTNNEFIRSALKDSIEETWFLDRVEKKGSAEYFIFHIGHDAADDGGSNPRFVSDAWLYIDSFTKKIYEYDLPNDCLIEWKK